MMSIWSCERREAKSSLHALAGAEDINRTAAQRARSVLVIVVTSPRIDAVVSTPQRPGRRGTAAGPSGDGLWRGQMGIVPTATGPTGPESRRSPTRSIRALVCPRSNSEKVPSGRTAISTPQPQGCTSELLTASHHPAPKMLGRRPQDGAPGVLRPFLFEAAARDRSQAP